MIVAVIALICALTGTAWAALGKNSVGSKQLKKNAVTTAKIKKEAVTGGKVKKDTLTGTQINEGTLGTVPSATSIPPAEAVHQVGAAGEPPFQFGNSNVPVEMGIQFTPVGFYKDQFGIVHLEGVVKYGGGTIIAFQLPPGYRPASGQINAFPSAPEEALVLVAGSNVTLTGINIEGDVLIQPGGTSKLVLLSGISFRAAS
jgi:hypothetical protein